MYLNPAPSCKTKNTVNCRIFIFILSKHVAKNLVPNLIVSVCKKEFSQGIWNPDTPRFQMVIKRLVCKWSSFWIGSGSLGNLKSGQKLPDFKWSSFQNCWEIWFPKSREFECFPDFEGSDFRSPCIGAHVESPPIFSAICRFSTKRFFHIFVCFLIPVWCLKKILCWKPTKLLQYIFL